MMEAAILAIVLLNGWAVLRACGLKGWGLLPLGFLAGTFLIVVLGAVLVVAGLPTRPSVILGLASLLALVLLAWRRANFTGSGLATLLLGLITLTGLVAILRANHLVSYHIDSFRYLTASGLLVEDAYSLASMNLLEKRLLAAPVMHSLAWLYGEQYVRSFSPLLMLALLGAIAWFARRGFQPATGTFLEGRGAAVAIGMGILLLVTNNRVVWNSFYVNDHLFFAAAFVPACALGWLLARGRSDLVPGLVALSALGLAGLVVTRPEGFIAGAFALLPMLVQGSIPTWVRTTLLGAYGLSTSLWFGYVAMVSRGFSGEIPLHTSGPLVVGIVALAGIGALRWLGTALERRSSLVTFELFLWLGLAVFTLRESAILMRSLEATYENVVAGEGAWGSSLVVLTLLVFFVILFNRDRSLAYLRFPVTAFVPTFFLIAYLQDSAYRVGHGDSLNRMLVQVVPLAVLYLLAALRSEQWQLDDPSDAGEAQTGSRGTHEVHPASR